jgi:hypothetical protein
MGAASSYVGGMGVDQGIMAGIMGKYSYPMVILNIYRPITIITLPLITVRGIQQCITPPKPSLSIPCQVWTPLSLFDIQPTISHIHYPIFFGYFRVLYWSILLAASLFPSPFLLSPSSLGHFFVVWSLSAQNKLFFICTYLSREPYLHISNIQLRSVDLLLTINVSL